MISQKTILFSLAIIFSLPFLTPSSSFPVPTLLASPKNVGTTYYVDATGGNDVNDGIYPASAWQTIAKVNSEHLIAGDSILFKRGEVWREKLVLDQSGTATHPITFGAYGTGAKPLLLGSVTQNNLAHWTDLGNNLWATADGSFPGDVGFILLGPETPSNIGTKCDFLLGIEAEVEPQHGDWYILNGVNEPKEYWHDMTNQRVVLYCPQNPALEYSNIELAYSANPYEPLIDGKKFAVNFITIEDLQLKYFNNHGMAFFNNEGISINHCDISYGGGEYQYWDQKLRFGNAIEFWESAKDCSVSYCKIWEIYDTALTNQGGSLVSVQENILYINNLIWNCHYSYEIWDKPETSVMRNIYFVNNTCIGAGFGWSFRQRRNPQGWHILLWSNTATVESFHITGNVFYESRNNSIYHHNHLGSGTYDNMHFDFNTYYETVGKLYVSETWLPPDETYVLKSYEIHEYADYQADTGQDPNSFFGNRAKALANAQEITDPEDHALLTELFDSTDILAQAYAEGEPETSTSTLSSSNSPSTPSQLTIPASASGFPLLFLSLGILVILRRLSFFSQKKRRSPQKESK